MVHFSDEWSDKLKSYIKKTFPNYSDSYIKYCISHSNGQTHSLLVINQYDDIVGCHLYYCTKAIVNEQEIETQWGHDTYLDEEYRKEIGVEFLLARKKIPAFGVGLTETNAKLRKLMKSIFLNGVFNYYTITPFIVTSPFQKLFQANVRIRNVETLKIKGAIFKKVHSVDEIQVPNGGFWYKDFYDLDFIRDASFLDERFFKCSVHDYKVYASTDSYFVVRESKYRGIPALMLSDFRYNPANPESAVTVLKAVMKIARMSHLGIVYFVCGDTKMASLLKKRIHYKTHLDFITSYKISPETTFSLCGGDSDADFLKA